MGEIKITETTSANIFLFTYMHMFAHKHTHTAAQLIKAHYNHTDTASTHKHVLTYTAPCG